MFWTFGLVYFGLGSLRRIDTDNVRDNRQRRLLYIVATAAQGQPEPDYAIIFLFLQLLDAYQLLQTTAHGMHVVIDGDRIRGNTGSTKKKPF